MAEVSELRERMERMLECPICMCQFNTPKVLPCQHTYCRGCLESLLGSKGTVKCPNCRRRHPMPPKGIDGFPPNVTIAELIEVQDATQQKIETKGEIDAELAEHLEHLENSIRYLRGVSEAFDEGMVIKERGQSVKAEISRNFSRYREILRERESHLKKKVEGIVAEDLTSRAEWRERVDSKLKEATDLLELMRTADGRKSDESGNTTNQASVLAKDILKVATSMPAPSQYHFTYGSQVLRTHITTYGSIIPQAPTPDTGRQREHRPRLSQIMEGFGLLGGGDPVVVDYYPSQKPKHTSNIQARNAEESDFSPFGLAISQTGDILATDIENHRVIVFSAELERVLEFGIKGDGNGELHRPTGIACDTGGSIFVADQLNNRVQVFDHNGEYLRKFGRKGSAAGEFIYPCGLAIDTDDRVFVCDSGNFRVQVLQRNGSSIFNFGSRDHFINQPMHVAVTRMGKIIVTDQKQYLRVFSQRKETHKFYLSQPSGVAIDEFGNMVVGDSSGRLLILRENGEVLCHIGTCGKGPGQLVQPRGVAITKDGCVAVGDGMANRIQLFATKVQHDVIEG